MDWLGQLILGILSDLAGNWVDEYGWITAIYMVWMIIWGFLLLLSLCYISDDFWVPLIPMGAATLLWAIYRRLWG